MSHPIDILCHPWGNDDASPYCQMCHPLGILLSSYCNQALPSSTDTPSYGHPEFQASHPEKEKKSRDFLHIMCGQTRMVNPAWLSSHEIRMAVFLPSYSRRGLGWTILVLRDRPACVTAQSKPMGEKHAISIISL